MISLYNNHSASDHGAAMPRLGALRIQVAKDAERGCLAFSALAAGLSTADPGKVSLLLQQSIVDLLQLMLELIDSLQCRNHGGPGLSQCALEPSDVRLCRSQSFDSFLPRPGQAGLVALEESDLSAQKAGFRLLTMQVGFQPRYLAAKAQDLESR